MTDPSEPWRTANAEALDRRSIGSFIDALDVSPLCKTGLHAMMTADNGIVTGWQSYLGNLAMIQGGGGGAKYWLESETTAAAAATSSWRSASRPQSAPRK